MEAVSALFVRLTLLLMVRKASTINVALNREVTLCSSEILPALLTDGDRTSSKNVAMRTSCWPENFVEIEFGNQYQVKYVELFEGDPSPSETELLLTNSDHFRSTTLSSETLNLILER